MKITSLIFLLLRRARSSMSMLIMLSLVCLSFYLFFLILSLFFILSFFINYILPLSFPLSFPLSSFLIVILPQKIKTNRITEIMTCTSNVGERERPLSLSSPAFLSLLLLSLLFLLWFLRNIKMSLFALMIGIALLF